MKKMFEFLKKKENKPEVKDYTVTREQYKKAVQESVKYETEIKFKLEQYIADKYKSANKLEAKIADNYRNREPDDLELYETLDQIYEQIDYLEDQKDKCEDTLAFLKYQRRTKDYGGLEEIYEQLGLKKRSVKESVYEKLKEKPKISKKTLRRIEAIKDRVDFSEQLEEKIKRGQPTE